MAVALAAARTAGASQAARGPRRVMWGQFRPPSLARDVRYTVHLPPMGPTGDRDLPILHFLHGFRDDPDVWEEEGLADICQSMQDAGEIPPLAVALPDGGRGSFTNAYEGPREEDAVFPDFVRYAETKLFGERPRALRAIAGISMGGYGALKIALKHPDAFVATAAMSGSFLRSGEFFSEASGRMGKRLREVFGPPGLENMREANDIELIARALDRATAPAVFLACGEQDRYGFEAGTQDLARLLRERRLEVETRIGPGRHTFGYWRAALPDLLRFVGRHFIGREPPS